MKGGSKMEKQSLNTPLSLFSSDKQKETIADTFPGRASEGEYMTI